MTLIYIVVHSRPVVVIVHQSYFYPEIFYICDMQSIYILEYRVLLQCYRACNTISGPWLLTRPSELDIVQLPVGGNPFIEQYRACFNRVCSTARLIHSQAEVGGLGMRLC